MSKASLRRPLALLTAIVTCLFSTIAGATLGTAIGVLGAVGTAGYLAGEGTAAQAAACTHPPCTVPLPDPTAYVANNGSGTLSVIDAATNTVTATVNVASGPTGVAVDPLTGVVYVTNTDSDSVSVVSPTTDAVTTTIPLAFGAAPMGIAITPNGASAYVADAGTNTVSVVDTSTNAVTVTIPVGSTPEAVAAGPVGAYVYVTNLLSKSVSVIATGSNTVKATVAVGYFPSAVTVNPLGTDAYVTNECGSDKYCDKPGTLSTISTSNDKVTKTTTVGYAPVAVTILPNDESLFVVNSCGPSITPPPKTLPGPDCADVNGSDPANVTSLILPGLSVEADPDIGNSQPGLAEGAETSPDGTEIYFANSCGSDSSCGLGGTVSVFNQFDLSAPIATITVGNDPLGVAFAGPWVPQVDQTSITTDAAPALATMSPYVYAAEIIDGVVNYEEYDYLTGGWSSPTPVPGPAAAYAPALTAVGSTLWVAWTTSSFTIAYNELDTTDNTWLSANGLTVPQAGTNQAPALAEADGEVWVAWKGHNTDQVGYESNNGSWSLQAFVPSATTLASPAIAGQPDLDEVYFAWKSETSNTVDFDSDIGGTFSGAEAQPQAATTVKPALAVTSNAIYLMWTQATTNAIAYSLNTPNGWTQQQIVPFTLSGAGPALTAVGAGNLYLAVQGLSGDSFWYDALD
jgi:YVTN family beta-propeller protein